ncbi:ribonuclease P protein subunit p29-like [Condylostylus longicornis]|uniref:ribonuclease P protein subunit p29-like n=1 Tax=Condylostylus longicornis TaxID=2530218 RepID=UPI00244DB8AF|nr:ribonuclease P protein subunit p29-like [Condylostylus longicornis]
MAYRVLEPLDDAPRRTTEDEPEAVVGEWLGKPNDAQKYLNGKTLRLDAYVDPKDKERRRNRKPLPKRFKLSKTELKKRGMLDITEDNLTFHDGLVLNALWRQYIGQILNISAPPSGHQQTSSPIPYLLTQCNVLAVSDFHGAHVKIIQAKNPSVVGMDGIVMQETEQTFRIVCRDNRIKTVLKSTCIFHLFTGTDRIFILHGKHLCYRTALRSKVKIKSKDTVQLQ